MNNFKTKATIEALAKELGINEKEAEKELNKILGGKVDVKASSNVQGNIPLR